MKTVFDMMTGDRAEIAPEEPRADYSQLGLELGLGTILIAPPFFSQKSMPPELARIPVERFLAGQG